MSRRQAKVVTDSMLRKMLSHSRKSSTPVRDQVIILLSCKAGLRACEIAGLEWSMILDPRGKIGNSMVVEDRIAKRQSGRRIPLHRDLRTALSQLRKLGPEDGPVIRSSRGGSMKPNSIVKEPFQAERMAQEFGGETYDILDRGKGSGWEKWRRKETPNKFARYG